MKKIIIFVALLAITAFTPKEGKSYNYIQSVEGKVVTVDGMRYLVLASSNYSAPFAVNLTKDKLECQYYQDQHNKIYK